ncbi:PTS glucose transporter subunit IIA [Yersinia sp. Marseille-Q3913]|nr:PTS glucose transporter subunit IIA [Yersinia sp. Marseille-Q3913]
MFLVRMRSGTQFAQSAATLCVAFKTKNRDLKQLVSSAGFTALLGITEPSLYSVTLKLKRPLVAAMIGGGCAGIYAGLSGVVRYAFVSPGLAALPAFIGENPMNIVHALITCVIAIVVTFALTWVLGFEDPVEKQPQLDEIIKDNSRSDTAGNRAETAVLAEVINSPLSGKLLPLAQVNDDVFSLGLLGQGVAITPEVGEVRAPVTGEIMTLCHQMCPDGKIGPAINTTSMYQASAHHKMRLLRITGKYYAVGAFSMWLLMAVIIRWRGAIYRTEGWPPSCNIMKLLLWAKVLDSIAKLAMRSIRKNRKNLWCTKHTGK